MKFISVKKVDGVDVRINTDKIAFFRQTPDGKTLIATDYAELLVQDSPNAVLSKIAEVENKEYAKVARLGVIAANEINAVKGLPCKAKESPLMNAFCKPRIVTSEKAVLPHPCDGPLYKDWKPIDYFVKSREEAGENDQAFSDWYFDQGNVEKWEHLMLECCDAIVAKVGLMNACGCDEKMRQEFMHRINLSNAKRDGGMRFAEGSWHE